MQVEHQLDVLLEGRGNAARLLHERQLAGRSVPRPSGCAARCRGPIRDSRPPWCGRPGRAASADAADRRITESSRLRSVLMRSQAARGSVLSPAPNRRSNTARGSLSTGSGVVGLRQDRSCRCRRRLARPRSRRPVVRLQRELERGELGLLAERPRRDLVHRDADLEVGALRLLGVDAGQKRRLAARVIAAALAREPSACGSTGRSGRSTRSRNGASGSRIGVSSKPAPSVAGVPGSPLPDVHAVRQVDDAEPAHRVGGGLASADNRRHHAVEQRQRQRRAQTAEKRAARKMLAW